MFSKGLVVFISLLLLLFIMLLYYMNMKTEKYPLTDNDPYNTSQCIHNYLLNHDNLFITEFQNVAAVPCIWSLSILEISITTTSL